MVEFDSISERLYGVVRQAGKETGKQVKFDMGGSIEMDRGVLDRMAPAFEHLLRNSVGHGIEPAAVPERLRVNRHGYDHHSDGPAGRPTTFRWHLGTTGQVNPRSLNVPERKDFNGADATISEADAANLIFQAGFSTAEQVTELSGRGIGMDVVRARLTPWAVASKPAPRLGQGPVSNCLALTTAVTRW